LGKTIQSLERGLVILEILGKTKKPLLLNEITEHFSIDRSSVFRLISTLVQNGFVTQNPDTKKYTLGYRILELSGAFSDHSYIEKLIRPIMERVVAETRQNTHLAILDNHEVVFLAVEQPNDPITLNISIGTREPSTATALGKSLLAFHAPEKLDDILSGVTLKKYTPKSITSIPGLKKELGKVRKIRLAVDDEEYRSGIVCFAAPVFNHLGEVQYSIGISGLRDAIKPFTGKFGEIVRLSGIEASEILGYKPAGSEQ